MPDHQSGEWQWAEGEQNLEEEEGLDGELVSQEQFVSQGDSLTHLGASDDVLGSGGGVPRSGGGEAGVGGG